MYKARFAKAFKRLRIERGWTKEKAAEVFQVSPSMIYKYEKGACMPEGEYLCLMADIFHLETVDELVGRRPRPTPNNRKNNKNTQ